MQLRDYQEDGLQALWSYFMTEKGNPCLAWPTGSGKSIVPAEFIRRTCHHYPNQRFLVVTHVKELIEQNYNVLKRIWPNAPVGVFSAGLKTKQTAYPIIYGGIQSMVKLPDAFGHRDIMFVDEAHLVSQDDASMYQRFIGQLKIINPYLKVIGMSATPYRLGQGMITDGGLFTHIAHDLTSLENFNRLVTDGWLCPLVPKKTATELDVSSVSIQKGEFVSSQLQHEVDKAEITHKALQEALHYGQNRKSWLIFATGIEHANHIAEMLGRFGVECASVHSKQTSEYNDGAIKAFKEGSLRAIANYGKLTTGFDHPGIDLIVMLRPTLSVALWVQMLGRGTRPAPGKSNCLVLDFAKNTARLGPINDPVIPRKKGDKGGDIPIKICEACGVYNHISARECSECGAPFTFQVKITAKAGTDELIKKQPDAPIIEMLDINYVIYKKHTKEGKPPTLKATYFNGTNGYSEWVAFEGHGLARHRAHEWWRQRHVSNPPATVDEAMMLVTSLRPPRRIRVHSNKKYPEILSCEF